MIDFMIDVNKKTYKIIWTGSELNKLYFLAEPIKPVKIVQGDKLILDYDRDAYRQELSILKSLSDNAVLLPSEMRRFNTTYKFALYDNPQYTGKPLREHSAYLGSKKIINIEKQAYSGRIIRVLVKCSIQVPEEMFWLEFTDLHEHIHFYLPPMEKRNNEYMASCLMPLEIYKKWNLCLDEQITDYMEIAKKE